MGNTIVLNRNRENIKPLSMTNTLTEVFLEVLVLSGSMTAKTNREKELIIWLAQRDQEVVGMGTVGFDIDELPWTIDDFTKEKEFLIEVLENAIGGQVWIKLNYEPNKEMVVTCLEHFKKMILSFEVNDVDEQQYFEWTEGNDQDETPTVPVGYPKCDRHNIFLSCHGCLICNKEY
ncbi:hypothetical protein MHB84_00815 [Paenibacillus sp. FSL F4-0087]|uniref:hypothetical protein n=1 Tax=Paenibacillus TaxID=44249 RepID=UPI00096F6432|nr:MULTISPECIES: hypothetical protein [Paenibacillus]MDR9745212.1 hypothetical protein [Paenibacillus taichungensis]OME81867.1 hypothetical protein BK122_14480 [Paenibacillus pabuli]PIH61131.1 hypothetical protein CS562_01525 [Paenibacillus sp. LK1]